MFATYHSMVFKTIYGNGFKKHLVAKMSGNITKSF